MTPQTAYADYTGLEDLNKTTLEIHRSSRSIKEAEGDSVRHTVKITNTGSVVAFQVRLRATVRDKEGKPGMDVLPAIYSDNYIELAPGEARILTCTYAVKDFEASEQLPAINGDRKAMMEVSGWNLAGSGSH